MKISLISALVSCFAYSAMASGSKGKGKGKSGGSCAEAFLGTFIYTSQSFGSLYAVQVGYNDMKKVYQYIESTPQCYVPEKECDDTTALFEFKEEDFGVTEDGACAIYETLTCVAGTCAGYSLSIYAYQSSGQQWNLCFADDASRAAAGNNPLTDGYFYNCNSGVMMPRLALRQ